MINTKQGRLGDVLVSCYFCATPGWINQYEHKRPICEVCNEKGKEGELLTFKEEEL